MLIKPGKTLAYERFMGDAQEVAKKHGNSKLLDMAHLWAQLIEQEILLHGRRLGEVAWRLLDQINPRGSPEELDVAGYMTIAKFLMEYWRYAEALRLWHNAQFAPTISEAAGANANGGILNIAVMPMKNNKIVAIKDSLRQYLEVIGRQRRINEAAG